ncbi:amidohydrolase family protein, partial [Candidatus Magnetomorum sp. HK-1]
MNTFDVIIQNANVYDGTGTPSYVADIAIQDGRIAAISKKINASAEKIIDASNKAVCPGFIDVHSHADLTIHLSDHHKILEPLLRQGVTTFVGGNCGMGPAPIDDYHRQEAITYVESMMGESVQSSFHWSSVGSFLETLDKQGIILNCGFLVPHGMLRIAAKGLEYSQTCANDLKHMEKNLISGLDAGALGMSTGLMYFPGLNADTEELTALAKVVSKHQAVFSSHIRSYSNTLQQAIDEIINLSKSTDVRIQISHLFHVPHIHPIIDGAVRTVLRMASTINKYIPLSMPDDRNLMNILSQIDKNIKKGIPLGADAMPTSTGFTHVLAFFPPWSLNGTREEVTNRLKDPSERKKIYQSIQQGQSVWPHQDKDTWSMNCFKTMGFRSIHLMSVVSKKNKCFEGMSWHAIAKARGQEPFDTVCDFLIEENGRVLVFISPTFVGDEFIEQFSACTIRDPNVSIVTDTILLGFGKPSHLFYDCYPKLFSKYVNKEKQLSLEEAIRKSTSLPAQQLGIKNRGIIQK